VTFESAPDKHIVIAVADIEKANLIADLSIGSLRKPRNQGLRPRQKRSLQKVNEHFVEGA